MALNIPFKTPFMGHVDSVVELSFSKACEGRYSLAFVGQNGLVIVRDSRGENVDSTINQEGHQGAVYGVSMSANASIVATGSEDGTARIWSVTSAQELKKFRHVQMVSSVALDTESKHMLTSSQERHSKIRLYDVNQSQECLSIYRKSRRGVRNVIFCRDDRSFLASSYDRTVELWDVSSGQSSHKITLPHHAKSLELCADGKTVTIAYGGSVVFFEAETFNILWHRKMPFKVVGASLHPQKKSFVSADYDGFIYKYSYDTGELQLKFRAHLQAGHNITTIKYSPDGEMYVSSSTDGHITLWPQKSENENDEEGFTTAPNSDSNEDADADPEIWVDTYEEEDFDY